MLFSYLLVLISLLVGVGFYTLMERKVLGYMQIRKGPNKVGFVGLLQPIGDGAKLFTKEMMLPKKGFSKLYFISPVLGLLVSMMGWSVYLIDYDSFDMGLGLLFFLVVSSLNVYVLMYSGWSSSCTFSLIGAYRGVAQVISYEVVMALVVLCVILHSGSYGLMCVGVNVWVVFMELVLLLLWFCVMLAEVNRSPFDFAEGESELVSGFNIEYGSVGFSLLFMGEYVSILLMGYLTGAIFIPYKGGLVFFLTVVLILWVRAAFPRYRYDQLSSVCWKVLLVVVLGVFIYSGGVAMLEMQWCYLQS